MTQIRTPRKRAYYPESKTEVDRLLLWIPAEEIQPMVQDGLIAPYVVDDYPDGFEIDVSTSEFEEFEIDLGVSPEAITAAYVHYREREQLPDSGMMDGATLESAARGMAETDPTVSGQFDPSTVLDPNTQKLPEPEMTDGEDAMTFLRKLQ